MPVSLATSDSGSDAADSYTQVTGAVHTARLALDDASTCSTRLTSAALDAAAWSPQQPHQQLNKLQIDVGFRRLVPLAVLACVDVCQRLPIGQGSGEKWKEK